MTDAQIPATVSALVVTAHGGPEVLQLQRVPCPAPGPDDLLVEVTAAGVNFRDVYERQGIYPGTPPFVAGAELAGTVLAVGSSVTEFAVGDRVATAQASGGSHATVALVPAAKAVPVPDYIGLDVAAATMLQGMTAHYLVRSSFDVQDGHEVLIHAAAGGVGQLLVQLAKASGAHVVATVGSEAKVAIARQAGADVVIRYDEVPDLAAAVRSASGGGVHVVYDGVGKSTFDASLASLRPRGMLVLFGGSSGQVPPFDLQRLNSGGSLFITRPTLGNYVAERAELLWRASDLFAAIGEGTLKVAIGGRWPLAAAAAAYHALESRETTGKLLLIP